MPMIAKVTITVKRVPKKHGGGYKAVLDVDADEIGFTQEITETFDNPVKGIRAAAKIVAESAAKVD